MSRRKHHRPGNPITAWADLMPFVGGAMTSYMMPHLLKLLTKGKFTMTEMEKACSTLLVVVLQKLEESHKERECLSRELAETRQAHARTKEDLDRTCDTLRKIENGDIALSRKRRVRKS